MEQREDTGTIRDNLAYEDLEQASLETSDKILPQYVPHAPNYWSTNNPFQGQSIATYVNPHALAADQGVLVLLPKSTASHYLASTHPTSSVGTEFPSLGSNGFQAHASAIAPFDSGDMVFAAHQVAGSSQGNSEIAEMYAEDSAFVKPSVEAPTDPTDGNDKCSTFVKSVIFKDIDSITSSGFAAM